ncbi:hypothetical protein ACVITL_006103 [Rhizobium pisi]
MSSSGEPKRASALIGGGTSFSAPPQVSAIGRTLFTVILSAPHSRATVRVSARTASRGQQVHERLDPNLSQPSLIVSIATLVEVLATWGNVEMRSPRTRR